MTNGERLEYKGEAYKCGAGTFGLSELNTGRRQKPDSGYITFPNGQSYQFAYIMDSFLWTDVTWLEVEPSLNENDLSYLPISSQDGELARYPADMIAAASIVQDEVEYNLEHPVVWEGEITLCALFVLAVGTIGGLCDKFMNSLSIFRVKKYYDINGEVKPSDLMISIRRIVGAINILGEIFLLIWSFYFGL